MWIPFIFLSMECTAMFFHSLTYSVYLLANHYQPTSSIYLHTSLI